MSKSKKFFRQRMIGLAMLILCVALFAVCAVWHEDCTAAVMLTPLSLVLMFSKKLWLA